MQFEDAPSRRSARAARQRLAADSVSWQRFPNDPCQDPLRLLDELAKAGTHVLLGGGPPSPSKAGPRARRRPLRHRPAAPSHAVGRFDAGCAEEESMTSPYHDVIRGPRCR